MYVSLQNAEILLSRFLVFVRILTMRLPESRNHYADAKRASEGAPHYSKLIQQIALRYCSFFIICLSCSSFKNGIAVSDGLTLVPFSLL